MRASSRMGGRGLSYTFVKGGSETTKLMNVINIPMQNSTVVRKMTSASASEAVGSDCKDSSSSSGATAKPMNPKEMALLVKKELSEVKGLKIELKDSEKKILGAGCLAARVYVESTGGRPTGQW